MTKEQALTLQALEDALADCRAAFGAMAYATVTMDAGAFDSAPAWYQPTQHRDKAGRLHIQRSRPDMHLLLMVDDNTAYRASHPEYAEVRLPDMIDMAIASEQT